MTNLLHVFTIPPPSNILQENFGKIPRIRHSLVSRNICSFRQSKLNLMTTCYIMRDKHGIFVNDQGFKTREKRMVFAKGFGFNNSGGGGPGRDNGGNARILGNLALAIGLTFLSMTGQLGGVFDAIGYVIDALVSLWLLAVVLPIVGLGAFLWWAGRDIVQSSVQHSECLSSWMKMVRIHDHDCIVDKCPNCGNEFQIFKSTLNDELQLCPFCTQPFSVVDGKFVRESVKFSNDSTAFGEIFGNSTPRPQKGKDFSKSVVDVEAEIKDVE